MLEPQKSHTTDATGVTGFSGPRALLCAFVGLLRAQAGIIIILLAALVLTEGVLRLARPDIAGQVYTANLTGGHPINFSERSFRVQEGQHKIRGPLILGLGDSTTFGTGVAAEETWPIRLGEHLEPSHLSTDLILPDSMAQEAAVAANAGFPGSGIRQLRIGLETLWAEPAPPPVTILLITSNMVSFTEFRAGKEPRDLMDRVRKAKTRANSPKERASALLQGLALWKAVTGTVETGKYALGLLDHRINPTAPRSPLLSYGWIQPGLPLSHTQKMWATFDAELAALHTTVQNQGGCLVIGFLPPRFMLSERRNDNLKFVPKSRLTEEASARVKSLAERRGLPFVDMAQALQQARTNGAGQLYIPNDYTHLSASGHDVVAQTFAAALTQPSICVRSQSAEDKY